MKFVIKLTDPDGVYSSIADAARATVERQAETLRASGISDDQLKRLRETHGSDMCNYVRQFVRADGSLRVEIDTETKTARVLTA